MNKIDHSTKRNLQWGLAILCVGHAIASYTSYGFHHPDEQFQILEWANYFVGFTPDATHLPWEFGSQIRSWFQPLIHAGFMKAFSALGMYNAFTTATFFRALYAALNIASLWSLWNYFQKKFSLPTIWFLFLSAIWFFPYIHVRTSSENLSGIFLSFALSGSDHLLGYTAQKSKKTFFFTGLLFGFAFLARFQIALGLVGVAAVLLWNDRAIKKNHLVLLLGFLLPIGLGVIIDRIGYGNWVFTPYRYFKVNLIDGVAASYNPYPWYQYFLWIIQLNPFVSLPLFYGVIRYCLKFKVDVFSAFVFSFFILHCFIRNKEYRFLFPILNVAPLMAVAYFQTAVQESPVRDLIIRGFQKLWFKAFVAFFAVTSLLAFCISTLHGASNQTLWAPHAVYRNFKSMPEVWLTNRNYLEDTRGFYYDLTQVPGFNSHEMVIYQNATELVDGLRKSEFVAVLIDGKLKDPKIQNYVTIMETTGCEVMTRAFPKFLSEKLNLTYQAVYRCHYAK